MFPCIEKVNSYCLLQQQKTKGQRKNKEIDNMYSEYEIAQHGGNIVRIF